MLMLLLGWLVPMSVSARGLTSTGINTDTPTQYPCFAVQHIELIDPQGQPVERRWQDYTQSLQLAWPICITADDIGDIQQGLTALMIEDGWITTRLGVPGQDLTSGKLQLVLVVGKLGQVLTDKALPKRRWRPALAASTEQAINLKDIEQTVEQLQRLPSQTANLQVVPSAEPGYSDLQLDLQNAKPRHRGSIAWNNQGDAGINTNQWVTSLTLDRPFGLTDQFNLNTTNTKGQEGFAHSVNMDGSIGVGYNTFKYTKSTNRTSKRIIGAVENFQSFSTSDDWVFDYTRRIYRNNDTLIDLTASRGFDERHSYIDGTEIDVQKRQQAWGKLALQSVFSVAKTNWQVNLSAKAGKPRWGGEDDPIDITPNEGTHRYLLYTSVFSLNRAWELEANKAINWRSTLTSQYSNDTLLSADYFSVGGAASVRGFSSPLSAEQGWHWRNEIGLQLTNPKATGEMYVALDMGEVSGYNTINLPGTQLVGMAIGQTGRSGALGYKVEVGVPLYGPQTLMDNSKATMSLTITGYF